MRQRWLVDFVLITGQVFNTVNKRYSSSIPLLWQFTLVPATLSPPSLPVPMHELKTSTMKLFRKFLIMIAVTTMIYLSFKRHIFKSYDMHSHLNGKYSVWPPFRIKAKHSPNWYIKECFNGHFSEDLEEVFGNVISTWSKSENAECADLYQKYVTLYEVHDRYSEKIDLPTPFAKRVSEWMKGDKILIEKIQHQHLIHVFHPLTSEHVVYNPVRSKRPMPEQKLNLYEWVDKISEESAKDCDFCKYDNMTAVDEFGRHITEETLRLSNTFKVEAWHSLLVTRNHHPINITKDQLIKLFQEGIIWMHNVSQKDQQYIYPNLAWDTLLHAGASQLHPHLHLMMSPDHYYGFMELLRFAAQRYYLDTRENYFSTVLDIHRALGLVVEHGEAVAIATITGKADLEVMLLSDYPGDDFFRLIYFTVQAYHDTFRQLCKSLGGAWPPLGTSIEASQGRIPAIARLVSRGDCTSLRADYSSLEIFQVVFRPHSPWQVVEAIKKAVHKYSK